MQIENKAKQEVIRITFFESIVIYKNDDDKNKGFS